MSEAQSGSISDSPETGTERVRGMGDWLVEVHDWLRQELDELRGQVDRILDGSANSATIERPRPDLAHEMRTHCVTFCAALTKHHTGEDMGAFPTLALRYPALAPDLTKLGEEHANVARLQGEIQRLVDGYVPGESDPTRLRDSLELLVSDLEAHFAYEERTVVAALNTLGPAPDIG